MELTLVGGAPNQGIGAPPTRDNGTGVDAMASLFNPIAFELGSIALGGGGSAMPCGLVLPGARAKKTEPLSAPDVEVLAGLAN